jgi:hypothetical protein
VEQAIPFSKGGFQLAPPRLQIAELGFAGGQLIGGQRSDPAAGHSAAIAFAEDRGQLRH